MGARWARPVLRRSSAPSEAWSSGESRRHTFDRDCRAISRAADATRYRHNPCYSESMPIGLEEEPDSIFRIEMRGMLRKADLDRCQARLAAEMSRPGPVRLLFVLDGFAGWEPRDNWSDLTFYAKHGDSIERIAIVGDERWRSEALMFAGAELRRAPVEYFAGSSREDGGARAWLSA